MRTGEPRWIADLQAQSAAGDAGLRTAVAVPIVVEGAVRAVLELFSAEPLVRDTQLLEALQSVTIQLGHLLERKHLEKRVAEATDAEQRRLGQGLHDRVGPQLAGIAMIATALLESLRAEGSPCAERVRALLARARDPDHAPPGEPDRGHADDRRTGLGRHPGRVHVAPGALAARARSRLLGARLHGALGPTLKP